MPKLILEETNGETREMPGNEFTRQTVFGHLWTETRGGRRKVYMLATRTPEAVTYRFHHDEELPADAR